MSEPEPIDDATHRRIEAIDAGGREAWNHQMSSSARGTLPKNLSARGERVQRHLGAQPSEELSEEFLIGTESELEKLDELTDAEIKELES